MTDHIPSQAGAPPSSHPLLDTIQSPKDLKRLERMGHTIYEAKAVGVEIAKRLTGQGVTAAVFDRGWYKFHGRVNCAFLF